MEWVLSQSGREKIPPTLRTVQSAVVLQDELFENMTLRCGSKAMCQEPRHFCTLDKFRRKTKELSCSTSIAVDIRTRSLNER